MSIVKTNKIFKIAFLIGCSFFLISLINLNDYGISWDEPNHFNRGQAYLWYFLTGDQTYKALPQYNLDKARSDPRYHQRSFYQIDSLNMEVWLKGDGEHPPLNDILASLFNYLFYQKLGLLGDVESYHLFNIFVSSILVALVFLFAAESFGILSGIFASIFLATYPLFFAESHFNIKDPAETTFILLTIYFFWKAINQQKNRSIYFAAFAAGIALSIKFNILFTPFILLPWVAVNLIRNKQNKLAKFMSSKKVFLSLIAFPFIMFSVLIIFWPFLWDKPIDKIIYIFKYYKHIGLVNTNSTILFKFWKIYPAQWVTLTTPPLLLFFFILSFFINVKNFSKKNYLLTLWVLLFIITIARVSLPKTNIYGGVRQIMEYIPALCLIAGVGAASLVKIVSQKLRIQKSIISVLSIATISVFLVIPLVKLHPNENVYFNFLIGGLEGATKANIPSAGNSFGNAYLQGLNWLNTHIQPSSKVALVQGTGLNIPLYKPRYDIKFNNSYWSGINREGEYLMEVTYNQEFKAYYYAWEYVDKMLDPVYEVKADNVPILKIWKNDLEHTKSKYQKKEVVYHEGIQVEKDADSLLISLPSTLTLTRLTISFIPTPKCIEFKNGYIQTSKDALLWTKELDPVSLYQFGSKTNYDPNIFEYLFAAREAKYIKIIINDKDACILHKPQISFKILE